MVLNGITFSAGGETAVKKTSGDTYCKQRVGGTALTRKSLELRDRPVLGKGQRV